MWRLLVILAIDKINLSIANKILIFLIEYIAIKKLCEINWCEVTPEFRAVPSSPEFEF